MPVSACEFLFFVSCDFLLLGLAVKCFTQHVTRVALQCPKVKPPSPKTAEAPSASLLTDHVQKFLERLAIPAGVPRPRSGN